MQRELRILIVEDSEDDHLIILRTLTRAGYVVSSRRVETREEMGVALVSQPWDLVISDYQVPGFGAASALATFKASGLDLPFIIVSGKVGEVAAVTCLREGAHDFILKDGLTRLPTAIERELGAARDRAQRREAKRQSRALAIERDEARDRLQLVMDATLHPVMMLNEESRITQVNVSAERAFGYSSSELIGRPVDLLLPESLNFVSLAHLARSEDAPHGATASEGLESSCRRRDGSEFPAEITLVPFDADGRRFVLITAVDVTERKRAEATLKENEERFRQIAENIDEVFWIEDVRSSRLIYVSPAFEGIWGRPWNELYDDASDWWNSIHPEDRPRVVAEARLKYLRGDFDESYRIVRSDGSTRWIRARTFPIRDAQERVCRIVGIASDLTEYRRLEHELLHAQKLESVGRLAAGIAHEINTPTQFVGDNLRFLREAFSGFETLADTALGLKHLVDDEQIEVGLKNFETVWAEVDLDYLRNECPVALAQAIEGVDRIAGIVSALKNFSRADPVDASSVDINLVIRNAITVCRNEWESIAEIEEQLDEGSPIVQGFAQDLGQVVLNLVVNAAHAIREKNDGPGRITVRSRTDGTSVTIEVEDDGVGIPDAIKPRIFEQFFTTKAIGQGTGLGLSICHGIITHKHGGSMGFESTAGVGTTFRFVLPSVRESA